MKVLQEPTRNLYMGYIGQTDDADIYLFTQA